jgi:hypothetical protein
MRDPGSIPRRVLMWNRDSHNSIVSLHWWPWRDWSLWPLLRRAPSRTVSRPLCRQCDNSTWSHTALLFQFHIRCKASFRLHNFSCWGRALWRAAIPLHSYTVSLIQWSTRLLPAMRDPDSIPRGILMWNRDSPVSVVSLQFSDNLFFVHVCVRVQIFIFIFIFICYCFTRKTKAEAVFLNPFTVFSSCKQKFIVCLFVWQRNKRKLPVCKQTKRTKRTIWICPSMIYNTHVAQYVFVWGVNKMLIFSYVFGR